MKNLEQIRSALLHIRKIEGIKVSLLGECYSNLGNVIWQILSEIHLHTIDGVNFSGIDLARSINFPESVTKRLIALLEAEGLIELSGELDNVLGGHLSLSELGILKVTQIVDQSANDSSHGMNTTDSMVLLAQS